MRGTALIAQLQEILRAPNVKAFGAVVAAGESGHGPDAYRMRYDGPGRPPAYFDDFSRHPKVMRPTRDGKLSSAAGKWQATWTTWGDFTADAGPMDFSPASQDLFFAWCLRRAKAVAAITAGRLEEACRLCCGTWTSLPGGAEENAATRSARETFERFGGRYAGETPPEPDPQFNQDSLATEHYGEAVHESTVQQEEGEMLPIAADVMWALLKEAVGAIPQLGALLGKGGSEVAQRNVAAGTIVANALVKAVGAPNLQAAVDTVKADPAAAQAARAAVAEVWHLVEVGGGIASARQAATVYAAAEWWRFLATPHFWMALILLGMVVMALGSIIGLWGFAQWTNENRSNALFLIVGGALGAVTGFYFGQSASASPARRTDFSTSPKE